MTKSERLAWVRGIAVFLLIVVGTLPFLTGEYQTRPMFRNAVSVILVVTGLYFFWTAWRARKGTPPA